MSGSQDEVLTPKEDVAVPPSVDGASKVERRRPGRLKNVSPHLLPLLRSPIQDETPEDAEADALRAPTGVFVSLAVSAGLWVGIAFAAQRLFFR